MFTLYGDGIHDDYPAIQEMINSGVCEVTLPAPKVKYLISKTLVLPSNFRLVLPRFAEICLMENSNCPMLSNAWKNIEDNGEIVRSGRDKIWNFVSRISPEKEDKCKNIEVVGGVWNFNNKEQMPNPLRTLEFGENEDYTGFGIQFFNVENLKISSMTLKDPITFALVLDVVSYFTIEDITFDFVDGNPMKLNMDGVHIDGNCHHGVIRNIKGACFDDLVALNAYEGYAGPISNIVIDGLFAEDCHSAVRLLAIHEKLSNIHITNVFGTYYQYCIGLSKFYPIETTDGFENIVIDNVYASKAVRDEENIPIFKGSYVFPLIWVQDGVKLKNLQISSVYRKEYNVPIETIYLGDCGTIENVSITNVSSENYTGKTMPLIVNNGYIKNFNTSCLYTDGDDVYIEKQNALK